MKYKIKIVTGTDNELSDALTRYHQKGWILQQVLVYDPPTLGNRRRGTMKCLFIVDEGLSISSKPKTDNDGFISHV